MTALITQLHPLAKTLTISIFDSEQLSPSQLSLDKLFLISTEHVKDIQRVINSLLINSSVLNDKILTFKLKNVITTDFKISKALENIFN